MIKNSEVTAFWSWNGNMSHQEIKNQLDSFKEEGLTGVFLHARAGLKLHYLKDDWFAAVECAILKAKEIGLDVYLYDEDGWPSGFAGGRVAASNEEYWSMPVEITKCPKENATILISYKAKCDGTYSVDPNGKDLFVVGYKSKYYVDLLNPNCVDAFINFTHEEYKKHFGQYFGNVIKGIFTDEPQLMQPYVYNKFVKESYQKSYNEDIDTKFYLLDEDSLEAKEFRLRYFAVVSNLFYNNFSKKISDWCEKNNMKLTGHMAGEDGLCSYKFNMGVMSHYINFQMPGIDFLGRRITSPVLMKQLESVKNQFGKEKVACEVFGGCGWNTNFNTLKYIWSYNAAFGVNGLCSHLSAYSIEGIRKRDYPAYFSYQEPWFKDYKYLVNTFKNLSDFVQEGVSNNDVLVLSPLTSVAGEKSYSDLAKRISTDYRLFLTNLLDKQIRFELTDESILAKYSKINSDSLSLVNSNYKIIFVPDFDIIYKSTLDILLKAKENGITVCFVSTKPSYVYDSGKLLRIDDSILADFVLINNRNKVLDKYLLLIKYKHNLEIKGGFTNGLVDQLIVNERKVGNDFYYLVLNSSETDSKKCSLKFKKKYAYTASPINNHFTNLKLINNIGYLTLCPMESVLIISSDESKTFDLTNDEDLLIQPISFSSVSRDLDNVLTIDTGCFKYDDGEYSEPMNLVKLQDEVFKHFGEKLFVKYSFKSKVLISNLKLCIEDINIRQIKVNGNIVSIKENYFIDKAITTFDISPFQRLGDNEVVVMYEMGTHSLLDVENIFETERNRFAYPVVVESIYLIGDFSVSLEEGIIEDEINHFKVEKPLFALAKNADLNYKNDITPQGLFFYRGSITYLASFECESDKAFISIPEYEGALIKLFVNDRFVSVVLDEKDIDISSYIKKGINNLKCVLVCSNRNTLGPHHHILGETIMTGIHTFKGERGFEDDFYSFYEPISTWTDSYSFVRNRIGKLLLKKPIK